MNVKKTLIGFSVIAGLLLYSSPAFAHVTVRPAEVGSAAYQTFTVGVPVEKDVPTTSVRLVIPEGVMNATPNVKPGWKIDVKKEPFGMKGEILNTGERAPEVVTEITWSGGTIPAGQRDEFHFSAQAPAEEKILQWKAYQTYEDGTVVAWDQDPKTASHNDDKDHNAGPLSETKVLKDLKSAETSQSEHNAANTTSDTNLPIILSIAAIIMSAGALFLQTRKKR